MNRWQRITRLGGVVLAALALAPASAPAATTGWNQTTGSWTYSDPANWVNNTVNGQFDSSLQVSGELRLQFPSSYNFTTALVFNHNPSATPLYLSPTTAGVTVGLGTALQFTPQSSSTLSFTSAFPFEVDLGNGARTINVGGSSSVFFSSETTISHGALIKTGTGSLILNGTAAFTGGISVQGGTLEGGSASSLGIGPITVVNPATLRLNATYPGSLTLNATPVFRGSGAFSGTTDLGSATRTVTLGTVGDLSASVGLHGEVKNGSLNLSGVATTSTVSLRAANPTLFAVTATKTSVEVYHRGALGLGTLTLNNGSGLRLVSMVDGDLSGANAVPNPISIASDVTLSGFNVGSIPELAGTVSLGSTTRTLSNAGGDVLISGTINSTGGAGVIITGGRLNFGGFNSFAGGVTVNGSFAALGIGRKEAAGTGTVTVNDGSLWLTGTGMTGANAVPNALAVNTSAVFYNPNTARVQMAGAFAWQGDLRLSGNFTFSGPINLGSFASALTSEGSQNIFSGPISGAGSLRISPLPSTEVVLSGNNSFGGGVTWTGTSTALTLGHKSALGTGPLQINGSFSVLSTSVVLSGATAVANQLTVNNDFTLAPMQPLELSGVIDLANGTRKLKNISVQPILLSGEVRGGGGSGALTLDGNGGFNLSGASTYPGLTTIQDGTVTVLANAAPGVAGPLGNATSAVVVGGINSQTARLLAGAGVTIGRDFTVGNFVVSAPTIGGGSGESWFTGGLSLTGAVNLSAATGARAHFTGEISNIRGVTKIDAGTVLLENANTYAGGTTVNAGVLLINNTSGSGTGTGPVTVNAGELGGSGAMTGAVTVGNGSGTADSALSPGDGIGSLETGAVTFKSDGVLKLELDSSLQTGDLLSAGGAVQLGNAMLTVTDLGGAVLAAGWQFTLIDNTSAAGTTGAFKNLPDGAVFQAGANFFEINYDAVLGTDAVANDVTATVTTVPEPCGGLLLATGALIAQLLRPRRNRRRRD